MQKPSLQVIFTESVNNIPFTDALYYRISAEQLPQVLDILQITQENIDTSKQERIDNWQEQLNNPAEPTEEQLQAQEDEINNQISQLQDPDFIQSKIDELTSQANDVQTQISVAHDRRIKV